MLIGYWETVPNTNPYIEGTRTVAQVRHISILTRSDKRKDRVEIAAESLHLAALQAEEFSKKTGTPMMVVGWYHSHPHITVFPSHVDLKTQLTQQMMDERFFGIIVSCFDNNTDNTEKVQITCFQSEMDQYTNTPKKKNIHLVIQPSTVLAKATGTATSKTKVMQGRAHDDRANSARELFLSLPEHMYDEYKKEFYVSNQSIEYSLRNKRKSDSDIGQSPRSIQPVSGSIKSVPDKMTELYNASVYGQLVTSLVDNIILPATHVLDLKAMDLDKQARLSLPTSFHRHVFYSFIGSFLDQ
ncbi:JAB1/Mov34/MPN/PAD-1 ubiquitin protease-domain-containing protein [Mycotypha africana]|uniref:JAB1/Mov34/MPN/PAD-1 ubiquitin protease-domain-containing protein n=1 Tax=Mycotypha africana TaxID=64632 RepID=UPI002301B943|nr:JAB1/Mov34/MPN/PAD-1 ubiquitin protease-domain-containing protein [Mycotypha africana]KAI8982335.1 JAB1/Mov34/MPN/PAD-1 ubiquitin protease-domain-containing protein [Mycotypha africana]